MPLAVELWTKFARAGASSRLRMLQYLPVLKDLGIAVTPHPLLPDAYVRLLHAGHLYRSRALAARSYLRRWRELTLAPAGDLQWVEGELFPFLPFAVESAFAHHAAPVIAEYDDALFHRYGLSRSAAVRKMAGTKIDQIMRESACVIAGNSYLAERARRAGAHRVEIVPTVVDARRYVPVVHAERARTVIGWIGSPVTQHYLYAIGDALREVCTQHHAVLRVVGADADVARQLAGVPVECVGWTEDGEASLVAGMDVGIMPLPDNPWERGKCGYKLIQYMACGLPVVASPVGVNADLVANDVNGFLAGTRDEWVDALSALVRDVGARARMGAAGRVRVEAELCIDAQAPRLAQILREVAGH
ncbi:MAG TPA: glycosyltransferase family 4 protein [Rhodanobacteraceae bacterium]